ncbi:MAG: hypothetical protein ABFD08_13790 [Syntrophomonas sp.]
MNDANPRVLIGSPVRQKAEILREFLRGCRELALGDLIVDYLFMDNNTEAEASQLLGSFAQEIPNTSIIETQNEAQYYCDEKTHIWDEELIWKVAGFKNKIIKKALKDDYDYLFLVDSDLVLHPLTLIHLISLGKDIVSEIFWTKWEPDFMELPQVWVSDQYNLFDSTRGESLTPEETALRIIRFIGQLKTPGVYRVGGLGACTLIHKKALQAGVNFSPIYNISFVGEDRHFCIRAAALGLELFVDTHYPAYHIYRISDLDELEDFKL